MIDIYCKRKPTVKDTTFGELFIPGFATRLCYTLEDAVRKVKINGKTAIPRGRYRIALVDSPKFGKDTLTLSNVPGFEYIRVHAGNDDSDTDGCPLVGMKIIYDPTGDGGDLVESKIALEKLKNYVIPLIKSGQEVYWNITG